MLKISPTKSDPKYIYSSESVGRGHPDKIADQISDLITDFLREKYGSDVKVACETICSYSNITVLGEISISQNGSLEKSPDFTEEDIKDISKEIKLKILDFIKTIKNQSKPIDPEDINVHLHHQSREIIESLIHPKNGSANYLKTKPKKGATDQGYSFGYASSFGANNFPVHTHLSHLLLKKVENFQNQTNSYFAKNTFSDMKSQVTGYYFYDNDNQKNKRVIYFHPTNIILSIQNKKGINEEKFREKIISDIIKPSLNDKNIFSFLDPEYLQNFEYHLKKAEVLINSSGSFHIGGLFADTGATGRKIVVDSYGGGIPVGGGAFSGKDPTKLDRSGAYYARYIAKNLLVALNLNQCLVSLFYAMGKPEVIYFSVDIDGDEEYNIDDIKEIIKKNFSLKIIDIIDFVNDIDIKFQKLSVFGHFARKEDDLDLPWERLDKVLNIKK